MTAPALNYLRALRPKQWTKNAVVLAPWLFALGDKSQNMGWHGVLTAAAAAGLFCLASSAVYLINDVHDLAFDRAHPTKRFRPIAAGDVPVPAAIALALLLLAGVAAGSLFIDLPLLAVIGGYVALQLAYTFLLKQVALLDLFVIAAGFVLRALAGGVALQVAISPWLLLCALLLALFLALCKRRHERVVLHDAAGATRESLRMYNEQVLDQLIAIIASATLVNYSLYTLWPDTVLKFGTNRLGFTIPFVIYGLFRYVDLVYREEKGGRPEQILLTDKPTLINVALYGATVLFIIFTA
jgi:4-hydroxybenzoate polyprenyltransferase